MRCFNPYRPHGEDGIAFPCGQCTACRINRAQDWTKRLYDELNYWNGLASFVTLTYNNENLPENETLVKKDLQLFFKRLRKNLEYDGRRIKYYACGEYGDNFGRPHYHAIIYGLSPTDRLDRIRIVDSWPLCDESIFNLKHIGDVWLKGNAIDVVNRKDIQYVAKYVQKKWTGDKAKQEYEQTGRIPPFALMSKGLGKEQANIEYKFMLENGFSWLDGKKVPIPRYYRKKFPELENSYNEDKRLKDAISYINSHKGTVFNAKYNALYDEFVKKYGSDFLNYPHISKSFTNRFERMIEKMQFEEGRILQTSFDATHKQGVK